MCERARLKVATSPRTPALAHTEARASLTPTPATAFGTFALRGANAPGPTSTSAQACVRIGTVGHDVARTPALAHTAARASRSHRHQPRPFGPPGRRPALRAGGPAAPALQVHAHATWLAAALHSHTAARASRSPPKFRFPGLVFPKARGMPPPRRASSSRRHQLLPVGHRLRLTPSRPRRHAHRGMTTEA